MGSARATMLSLLSHTRNPYFYAARTGLVAAQPGFPRGLSAGQHAREENLRQLPTRVLQEALGACKVDYRSILEKKELAALVQRHWAILPMATQEKINSLIVAPRDAVNADVMHAQADRVARLRPDEQYSVRVFQEARPAVTHIKTVISAPWYPQSDAQVPSGTGSGFVWDEHGHVVTNFHVVMNSQRVRVSLSNQQMLDAKVVGADANNDLAVLRLEGSARLPATITPISLGTSHDLMVGQRVFAIGNPFGLEQTLTAGIVSSVNRQIQGVAQRTIRDVIQTDAAINPGNSGGPLLDSQARLVGVNTMIYSPSGGGNVGIGFAVPVNTVRRSVVQIIKYGRVRRGRAGVFLLADEPAMHMRSVLQLPMGVLVRSVEPGSGAEAAGIRGFSYDSAGRVVPGDLIVEVGGERVQSSEDVASIVEQFSVGDQVPFTLMRGNERVTVVVPLVEVKNE